MFSIQARNSLKKAAFCCIKSSRPANQPAATITTGSKTASTKAAIAQPKVESRKQQRKSKKHAAKRSKSELFIKVSSPQDFEEKVKCCTKPVIVDFHANWCNPCKQLTPILESIIVEQGGAVKLAKVDVDENCDLAMDYKVSSIPALVVMKNGEVVNRLVGLQERQVLREWVAKYIK